VIVSARVLVKNESMSLGQVVLDAYTIFKWF